MAHDVFISYAHSDNEIPDGATRGWVTSLVDALRKTVREIRGGAPPDIWMDHALEPNEIVSESLQRLAAESPVLVLIMSRGYLQSRWCKMELKTFLDAHGATKNKESVFIVETLPTDRDLWHPRLRSLSQVLFWEQKFEQKAPTRYGYPLPDPRGDRPFYDRANELAHFVAKRLDEVDSRTPTVANRPVVWVAEPPIEDGDLILHRESLARSLRQSGADVIPGGAGSYSRDTIPVYRDEAAADIARASLLVQLFGLNPGRSLGNSALTIGNLQDQLARASDLTYLRWRSPTIELDAIDDPAWRQLLQTVSTSSIGEFTKQVLRALHGEPQAAQAFITGVLAQPSQVTPTAQSSSSSLTISVSATPGDSALRDQVANMLEDLDASVLLIPEPQESIASATYRTEFERVIGDSDGVVIVYGGAPASWAMSAFQFSKKILAQKRRGIWGVLLDGPPPQKPDHGVRSRRELMLLDCRNRAIERALLEPFVTTLRDSLQTGAARA